MPAAGWLDQREPAGAHRLSQSRPAHQRNVTTRQRQPRAEECPDGPRTDDKNIQAILPDQTPTKPLGEAHQRSRNEHRESPGSNHAGGRLLPSKYRSRNGRPRARSSSLILPYRCAVSVSHARTTLELAKSSTRPGCLARVPDLSLPKHNSPIATLETNTSSTSARRVFTAASDAKRAMMMLVSSKYLPLIRVNLFASLLNSQIHARQVCRQDGVCIRQQLLAGNTARS